MAPSSFDQNEQVLLTHITEVNEALTNYVNSTTPPSSPSTTPTSPLLPQLQLRDKTKLYNDIRNLVTHSRSMGREVDFDFEENCFVLCPVTRIFDSTYATPLCGGNRYGSICDISISTFSNGESGAEEGEYCGFHLENFDPKLIKKGRLFDPVTNSEELASAIEGPHNRFVLGDYTVTHNTTGMLNLLFYLSDRYPVGLAFMGSPGGYNDMCSIMHPLYVRNEFDADGVKRSIERQTSMANETYGYMGNYSILIIDDCTSDKQLKKGESSVLINKLFKEGSRHYHQLFMLGLHGLGDFTKAQARACSYVILFAETSNDELYELYRKIGGSCGSNANFRNLMDAAAPSNYKALVIKKRNPSRIIDECFFCWETIPKSKMPGVEEGTWKFGSKEYREWAEKRYASRK